MNKVIVLTVAVVLGWAGGLLATTFTTPVLDGSIGDDWDPDEQFETALINDYPYTLWLTWDEGLLWIGIDCPDGARRFLGDGEENISFFVAIDTDQTFGSGGNADGYGNVYFSGCYMPEFIYYFAGGMGWYEWSSWNGTGWDWMGWRNDNTYYGWDEAPDDELGILWSDIGNPTGIVVIAWITDETTFACNEPGVLAAWPSENPVGVCPTLTWGYQFFMPHIPDVMPVAGFSPNSIEHSDGSATATEPTTWGVIKSLYR